MSVWSNPPHLVHVQLMDRVQDSRGSWVDKPSGEPIAVPCSAQSAREWSTAEENLLGGLQILNLTRIFSKTWPGDESSIVFYDGGEWETVGAPQHFDLTKRTAHWVITLRRRGDASWQTSTSE